MRSAGYVRFGRTGCAGAEDADGGGTGGWLGSGVSRWAKMFSRIR
jgi:hypothetical protein